MGCMERSILGGMAQESLDSCCSLACVLLYETTDNPGLHADCGEEIDKTDPLDKLQHKMNLVSNYFTK
jgi:hypothetical protein